MLTLLSALALWMTACSREIEASATKREVTREPGVFEVDHPEQFKLALVETRDLPTVLHANGSVTPDVKRTIHLTSLGSGRVVDLRAQLGDYVRKGQTLLLISSPELGTATADYQKARADLDLARKAMERAQLLYSKGALAEKDLQVAQDASDKAKVDFETAEQRVRVMGGDPVHPGSLIELRAPVSGTIVEQNVAGFEGVKSIDNTPTLFTIADLSQVWVVCDVYENDLGAVRVGDSAEIRLNAYPDRVFHGRVSDISRVLDPSTRAAKVRIVLDNPGGSLRPGMYAVATFRSRQLTSLLVVPTTAIMRLHDKDWVFCKEGSHRFRRVEVQTGSPAADGFSELLAGVKPGEQIVSDALQFSTEAAEQKE